MAKRLDAPRSSRAVGVTRLSVDAVRGLTDVVEAMHGTIVHAPFPIGRSPAMRTKGLTRFVYQSIRAATEAMGAGLELVLPGVSHEPVEPPSSRRREVLLSVLNGVVGDHLAATANPLSIAMTFRVDGRPVEVTRDGLEKAFPQATGRVLVLVHGLCMNDLQWKRRGHDHGESLAEDLGYSALYLRYNTGRHISENGRELAAHLERLCEAWPVPIDQLVILGHSMGGLVTRSACHYGRMAGASWLSRLAAVVFLGTPHHGAALERAGNLFNLLIAISPYVEPIARIGGNRSAGISDLRHGNVIDEDWKGRDRQHRLDPRTPVPLPKGAVSFAVAASRGTKRQNRILRGFGDGLVSVPSALGKHADSAFAMSFEESNQWVVYRAGHFDLLDSPEVYRRLRQWLEALEGRASVGEAEASAIEG